MDVRNGRIGSGGELDMEARLAGIWARVAAWLKRVGDSAGDIFAVRAWVVLPSALKIRRPPTRDYRRTRRLCIAARTSSVGACVSSSSGEKVTTRAHLHWCRATERSCRRREDVDGRGRTFVKGSARRKTGASQHKAGKTDGGVPHAGGSCLLVRWSAG